MRSGDKHEFEGLSVRGIAPAGASGSFANNLRDRVVGVANSRLRQRIDHARQLSSHVLITAESRELLSESEVQLTTLHNSSQLPTVAPEADSSVDVVSHQEQMLPGFFEPIVNGHPNTAIIVLDAKSQLIIYVNEITECIFGLRKEEMIGKGISIFIPVQIGVDIETQHQMFVKRFLDYWQKHGKQRYSKIIDTERQVLARRKNSSGVFESFTAALYVKPLILSQASVSSLPTHFVGFIRDVEHERLLKTSLCSYKFIVNHSSEAVVICNFEGVILNVNPAFGRLFGYDLGFLVGKNISFIMPERVARQHDMYLRRFIDNLEKLGYLIENSPVINKEREFIGRRADAVEFPVSLRVKFDKEERRLIGFFNDRQKMIPQARFIEDVYRKILPETIADDLLAVIKSGHHVNEDRYYDDLAVVLIDLEGFTRASALHDARTVNVDIHDMFYYAAKSVAPKYRIHIVKSTGDGFIALVGLHKFDIAETRVDRAVCFSHEMSDWAKSHGLRMRVGIAKGQVGSKVLQLDGDRIQWDVFGPTICVASRMESNSLPHQVRLDPVAYQCVSREISDHFAMEEKEPKNLTKMNTYYILLNPALSARIKLFSDALVEQTAMHVQQETKRQEELKVVIGRREHMEKTTTSDISMGLL